MGMGVGIGETILSLSAVRVGARHRGSSTPRATTSTAASRPSASGWPSPRRPTSALEVLSATMTAYDTSVRQPLTTMIQSMARLEPTDRCQRPRKLLRPHCRLAPPSMWKEAAATMPVNPRDSMPGSSVPCRKRIGQAEDGAAQQALANRDHSHGPSDSVVLPQRHGRAGSPVRGNIRAGDGR
ncbi:unnamed protein product [Prorocentrum cordatum]|uniref:Uncharacterized protein n=1 Tax=Prorocentrum cordatum TaxID=2364126 RepID=A0ABN9XEH3_9DINO|nr:unnamed protein product [Polarella glacialis]